MTLGCFCDSREDGSAGGGIRSSAVDNRSGHGWLVGPTPQLFLSESQLSPFPISGQICHNSLVVWLGCHLYVDDMKRLDSGMEIGETWILAEPVTHEPWQGIQPWNGEGLELRLLLGPTMCQVLHSVVIPSPMRGGWSVCLTRRSRLTAR